MAIGIHNLKPFAGARKNSKRVGRGNASGRGTYSGKGQKGQRARSGGRKGLQLMALKNMLQSTPKKRGFTSLKKKPEILNLSDLKVFEANSKISPAILLQKCLVRKIKNGVKILGNGEIQAALNISGCQVSAGAKLKIEKAGGRVESK